MVPTPRAAALAAIGLVPAALAGLDPLFAVSALAIDLAVAIFTWVDWSRAPRPEDLSVERRCEPVISAHARNPVHLSVTARLRPLRGALRDAVPPECDATGAGAAFELPSFGTASATYLMRPARRGEHEFGDLTVRLRGPWGLAFRQFRIARRQSVRAYPDLIALSRDAAILARPDPESGLVALKRAAGEGREFESLREYVRGDDYRAIDWKATARRGRPIARHYEPERNQTVMLMVDCGRHMVSQVGDRTKLDFAVDAALRLSRVSLDRGDQVGLCAFGAEVHAFLAPKKGREALRGLVEALYRLEPELLESDCAAAFDLVAARIRRRALVAVFSDLLDEESSRQLVARATRLRPRHLPLVIAVADSELLDAGRAVPRRPEEAYLRAAAQRLLRERDSTLGRLRDAGSLVVSVPARELCAAAVNKYLEVKARGLL